MIQISDTYIEKNRLIIPTRHL